MTNAMIIMNERLNLMEAGVIGTTGKTFEFIDANGEKIICNEPEQIHTFQHWKALGYSVKKGEKAIAKFSIWKYSEKKPEDGTDEETIRKMFMKTAAFFSAAQVEKKEQ